MAQWNKTTSKKLNNNDTLFEMVMFSDQEGNPINTFGSASNIPLANGSLTGYTAVHKFGMIGYRLQLSNRNIDPIWNR